MADDVEEIKKLKARYFRTLDQRDWDGYADVFTDDVVVDVRDDAGPDAIHRGRAPYLEMLQPFLEGAITVHHGHMPEIEITGEDTATGTWSMQDQIWFAEGSGFETLSGSGWYIETYRKVDGQWKIAEMTLRRQRVEMAGTQIFPR